ncbi:MAG: alpha/beta hydrolase family protein [Candidatus Helarchaeota archaeon]
MNFKKFFLIGAIVLLIAGPTISYTTTFQGVRLIDEEFTSFDGTIIRGTVIIPQNHLSTGTPAPLIVLMHGFTASKEFFYLLGAELARHGYVCFTFNARGHQNSGNESSLAYYEIKDFQTAITYMLSKNATYRINTTQIGIIGHSHGAMCATIVGAIDPRVKATIPISTGANTTDVIAKFLGLSLSSVFDRLRPLINFAVDFTDPAEVAIRSPIAYVNASYPSNLLLINGDLDEAFSIQENKELLAKAIWNDTGRANEVIPGQLYTNSSGLRRLVVEHNVDHLMEAFMPETMNETLAWMDLSFYGGQRESVNTMTILFMFSGVLLTLFGAICGFFTLTAYLCIWIYNKRKPPAPSYPSMTLKERGLHFLLYFGTYAAINLLVPLLLFNIPNLHSWIPILLTDLLSLIFLFQTLLSIPILLFLLKYEKQKYQTTLADYGLDFHGVGAAIVIGLVVGFFFVALLSLAISDFLLNIIPADFGNILLVFLSILPYIFVLELWGRGFMQTKLTKQNDSTFTEILTSSLIIGLLQAIGAFLFFTMFHFITGSPTEIIFNANIPPVNVALFMAALFGTIFFGLSLFGAYLFKKTHNLFTSTLFITIVLSWILTAWPPRFI